MCSVQRWWTWGLGLLVVWMLVGMADTAWTEFDRGSVRGWTCYGDMNDDGAFTISDVGLSMKCVFFYPGDLLLYLIMHAYNTTIARFFEATPAAYGGTFSELVSVVVWVPSLCTVLILLIPKKFFMRKL